MNRYTKNLANYLRWTNLSAMGTTFHGCQAVAFSGWFHPISYTGTNGGFCNRLFSVAIDGGAGGLNCGINPNGTAWVGGRSTAADAAQQGTGVTAIDLNRTHHFGFVVSYANDFIEIHIDGRFESRTAVTFGSLTYNQGVPTVFDYVANSQDADPPVGGTQFQFDGYLGEFAWFGLRSMPDFAATNRLFHDLYRKKISPLSNIFGVVGAYPYIPQAGFGGNPRHSPAETVALFTAAGSITTSNTHPTIPSGRAGVMKKFRPVGKLVGTAGSGISYPYVGSGGINLAGNAALNKGKRVIGAGGITLSGLAGLVKSKSYIPSGQVTMSGAAATAFNDSGHVYPGSGGITLGGTAVTSKSKSFIPSGGINVGGSATTRYTSGVDTGSGGGLLLRGVGN